MESGLAGRRGKKKNFKVQYLPRNLLVSNNAAMSPIFCWQTGYYFPNLKGLFADMHAARVAIYMVYLHTKNPVFW
jgi:hypothetical protein